MIYFDNAATSFPKAPSVAPEMVRFLAEDAANPQRTKCWLRTDHVVEW